MMLAQQIGAFDILIVLLYVLSVIFLGWLGYRRTKTAADYMVGGRKTHPFIMAMSYGATFISTSAIVGFGGVAGLFGMSLLWLTALNIGVGIFIAFVVLGGPTRRIGHALDAHTYPELLGRRFQSKFIQVFAGLVIFLGMPLYAAAVMIGGAEFVSAAFPFSTDPDSNYRLAVLIFALITAAYVFAGGLKAVMYTDALQGTIMFVGMAVLLVWGYSSVGGVTDGHQKLTDLAPLVPQTLKDIGHQGWTAMPKFGFGEKQNDLWWIVVSTIVMGVGIGVLAQPQLNVRFMTVKSKRELNRAVLIGGIFILMMTGVAFTIGSLSNAYFAEHGRLLTGRVEKMVDQAKGQAILQLMKKDASGKWVDVPGKKAPVVLDAQQPYLEGVTSITPADAKLAQGRSISIVYAGGNPDQIIPTYITSAMPKWFGLVFLLTLLAAAMSTMSSQYHTLGTAFGRDVVERLQTQPRGGILYTRLGIFAGLVVAVTICLYFRGEYIVARATSIFFGLCASTFLPTCVGGLYFKRMTKAGAIASMVTGFTVTAFWLVFIKGSETKAFGLVQWITGDPKRTSLLDGHYNWPSVDQLFIALPISVLAAVVVSLVTRPPSQDHLQKCFHE